MTLGEAREIFDGWPDYPPVFLMLKGIVDGLAGGSASPGRDKLAEMSDQDVRALFPPQAIRADDAKADEVSAGFLGRLPKLARPDPTLAQMQFTPDLEAMQKKNLARRVEIAQRKAKADV